MSNFYEDYESGLGSWYYDSPLITATSTDFSVSPTHSLKCEGGDAVQQWIKRRPGTMDYEVWQCISFSCLFDSVSTSWTSGERYFLYGFDYATNTVAGFISDFGGAVDYQVGSVFANVTSSTTVELTTPFWDGATLVSSPFVPISLGSWHAVNYQQRVHAPSGGNFSVDYVFQVDGGTSYTFTSSFTSTGDDRLEGVSAGSDAAVGVAGWMSPFYIDNYRFGCVWPDITSFDKVVFAQ